MENIAVRRALLSVWDKTGIIDFARGLNELGVEILSTGGTARSLAEAGIEIVEVDNFTGFPEMLDGRVKTLHPKVHAGILHRRDDESHLATMEEHSLEPIDLVVVNLYPFVETVARPGVTRAEAIEQIDIGGPTMLRSAAKNHSHVTVVSSPDRYEDVLAEMRSNEGATTRELREALALEVFQCTAAYDTAISAYLAGEGASALQEAAAEEQDCGDLPGGLSIELERVRVLRYGENPHQHAALYGRGPTFLDSFEQLNGKEISYNNILDLVGALEVISAIEDRGAAVAIIKHSNPCGAAYADSVEEAWHKALACDPQSASGGIISCGAAVDEAAANVMKDHFIEVLVAPDFSEGALSILREKKNRILLRCRDDSWGLSPGAPVIRGVPAGLLAQSPDDEPDDEGSFKVVTERSPSEEEMRAMLFGWSLVRYVKSNAIVYSGPDRLLGVGAGQMSRVDSARIAASKAEQAGLDLTGSAVASDAFFPFADGLIATAEAGATAVIQPGGSVRDEEVIAAANEKGLAMVFTGRRHFRH